MKGIIENLLEYAGIKGVYRANRENPTFHPGRCADVLTSDGAYIGTFGELHPSVAGNYTFDAPVYIGELDFETLFEKSNITKSYSPLPKFPATTRDFSFVCDESLEVGEIEAAMRKSNVKLIESIKLFDVFRGEKLGAGKKSVSFSVSLRAPDRTLTVEEADKFAKKILSSVEAICGITIRQ